MVASQSESSLGLQDISLFSKQSESVIHSDSDPRLQLKRLILKGFQRVRGLNFNGIFNCLATRSENCICSDTVCRSNCGTAGHPFKQSS